MNLPGTAIAGLPSALVRGCLPALVFFLCAATAHAVWDRYSPFEPGQRPAPFPLAGLAEVSSPSDTPDIPRQEEFVARDTRLKVVWSVDGTVTMTLAMRGVDVFAGPLADGSSRGAGMTVHTADLNADGLPDYVIFTYSGGCGLAAQMSWVTFLLSSPTGYTGRCMLSYDAEPADFMAINGRVFWMQTSFVYGDEGKDGRNHNYWVYNLRVFSGTTLVLANDSDHRFPKWVLYSFGPNHRNTDQLTAVQRQRLWRESVISGRAAGSDG